MILPKSCTTRWLRRFFSQYETTHTVNPARIVSMFTDEDEQREVAGLFNATIHQVEGKMMTRQPHSGRLLSASSKTA